MFSIIVLLTAAIGLFVEDIAKVFHACWESAAFRHFFCLFWLTFFLTAYHQEIKTVLLWLLSLYSPLLQWLLNTFNLGKQHALVAHVCLVNMIAAVCTIVVCAIEAALRAARPKYPSIVFAGCWLFIMSLSF